MGPPPATPTPSRFLVPRKSNTSTQQSHQRYQTPGVQRQDANVAPRQFYATPRFSSSSKPPPSSDKVTWTTGTGFPTPALLKPKTPRNSRSTQDIIDSSPDSPEALPPSSPTKYSQELPEPIELASSLIPESPSQWSPGFEAGRSPKRRRISIASTESDVVSITTDVKKLPDDIDLVPASSFPDEVVLISEDENDDIYDNKDEQADHRSYCSSDGDQEEYFRGHKRKGQLDHRVHTKPIFFDPPPFKPHDRTETARPPNFPAPDHLGDIFSPSKQRGAKYVSGGLAAELRDWLVDVKTESERSSSVAMARLTVGSFRDGGPGMTFISGQPTTNTVVDPACPSAEGIRAILVGEGGLVDDRTGGLDKRDKGRPRKSVSAGAVVGIAPPAWDIQLPGQGKWAVAYRWEVVGSVDDGGGDHEKG